MQFPKYATLLLEVVGWYYEHLKLGQDPGTHVQHEHADHNTCMRALVTCGLVCKYMNMDQVCVAAMYMHMHMHMRAAAAEALAW